MPTYIAFLRGINVSGHNKIKMIELKQLLNKLSFKEVITYIQSGNVIFKSEKTDITNIQQTITSGIEKQFGYTIKVIIITKNQLKTIFCSNPFIKKNREVDISKLYVSLLNKKPDLDQIQQIEKLNSAYEDDFKIIDKTIYLHIKNGFSRTKLTNNLFERNLKTYATTRNWKTITKLIELSN